MCYKEIDTTTFHPASLTDANRGEHTDQGNEDGAQNDKDRINDARLGHNPAGAEKHNNTEYIDQAGGEYTIPSTEEHRLRDEEIRTPPVERRAQR